MSRRAALPGAVATVAFLVVLGVVVGHHGHPLPLDRWGLRHAVPGTRADLARRVTVLGTSVVCYGVLVVLGAAAAIRTRRVSLLAAPLILLAAQLVRHGIADAVGRHRPDRSHWLAGAGGYSFPSGHTANATVAMGLAAVLLLRLLGPRPTPLARVTFPALAALVAVAVGVSRVLLGVHWVTDVLAGWAYGAGVLAVAAATLTPRRRSRASAAPGGSPA